jgi:hypothetical protein
VFWKGQLGYTYGVMIANRYFENVARHTMKHRELKPGEAEENVRLEFRPQGQPEMLVAYLWSRWTAPGEHSRKPTLTPVSVTPVSVTPVSADPGFAPRFRRFRTLL